MTKRLQNTVWACLLVLQVGPTWYRVKCDQAKPSPNGPATVEAQAKFFQDFFSVQLSPYKIEFGHVCEDPHTWEQRYESNDYQNHRNMGKVRWGDKKGGYGEHYWDLNHAGGGGNNQQAKPKPGDDDDGSYDPVKYETPETFDEPNEPASALEIEDTPSYDAGLSNYDAEKASYSPFDESGRRKRHHIHQNIKSNKRHTNYDGKSTKRHADDFEEEEEEDEDKNEPKNTKNKYEEHDDSDKKDFKNYKNKYDEIDDEDEEEEPEIKPTKKPKKNKKVKDNRNEPSEISSTKTKFESAVESLASTPQYFGPPKAQTHYVPYVQGGGIRQPYQTLSPGPRLFLEPSTGHVVDRETGQAYVLQPIHLNNFS